ncbi:hypothetical protein PC120_g12444 [Phytophthora cactorum]|nr:hypothetical protein PC120_g12444 [Phytophthora cactorum]
MRLAISSTATRAIRFWKNFHLRNGRFTQNCIRNST